MIHLLLVDDRQDIVKRIAKSINWTSLGIKVFTAYNGQDAYELLQRTQIDILVTDIKMPIMSGIELIERCNEANYKCKYILISGYDDFQYAKQAIRLSVSDYLLKPIQLDDLIQSIQTVKSQILVERQLEHSLRAFRAHEQRIRTISKNDAFVSIISRSVAVGQDEVNALSLSANLHDLYMITINIHDINAILERGGIKELNLMKYALANISKEIAGTDFFCDDFNVEKGQLILILSAKNKLRELQAQYKLYEISNVIQATFQAHFKLQISMVISEHYTGVGALKRAYESSHRFLEECYQHAYAELLLESEWKDDSLLEEYPVIHKERLMQSICLGDTAQAIQQTKALCEDMAQVTCAVKTQHIAQLCKLISALCQVKEQAHSVAEIAHQLQQMVYFEELQAYLLAFVKQLCEPMSATMSGRNLDAEILRVQKYLEDHYHQNISLKEIAETLYMSPSYISAMFKEVVGVNFNAYLTNVRIEHAKELLQTEQFKIYEIAERVGYRDAKYFSEIFKKSTGLLPKEWCRQENGAEK